MGRIDVAKPQKTVGIMQGWPGMSEDLAAWLADLSQELSAHTREAYESDLLQFARWFESTNGEAFSAAAVIRTDIRD